MSPDSPSPPTWTLHAPRRIDALDLDRPEQPWFDGALDAVELRQLAGVMLGVPPEQARALLRGTRADLRAARRADLSEVPVEWWEVREGGQVVGRLYLWAANTGALFVPPDAVAPTSEGIVQGSWHGDAATGERLHRAAADLLARGEAPDSQVHRTRFQKRPRKPVPMDRLRAAAARMKKDG